MEFVTFDDKRFSVVQNGEKFFAVLPGESMPRITAYDYWNDKPSKFVFYSYGVGAFFGKIRVKAGRRIASRMITIYDMGLLGAVRRAMIDGDVVVEEATGDQYRYGAIFHLKANHPLYPAFRVRLDPV